MNNILSIAVLVPCYNEEKTVVGVVKSFKKSIPSAKVYVFDNNSTDRTSELAIKAGAIVKKVRLPGKGNVVRRMFADVEADVYLMVDGDDTYDAKSGPNLIKKLLEDDLDMVVGCRVEDSKDNNNYRLGHRTGNKLLTGSVQKMFGGEFTDMLSGYRAFSRRFVKSFPAESKGFEIETELTVHTLEMRMPYGEVSTPYFERPEGSESKLSTYKDGIRILSMILRLYSNEKPMSFWGIISLIIFVLSIILVAPVVVEYIDTGEVPRFPSLIAGMSLMILSFLSFSIGLILRTVTKGRFELKHFAYLSVHNNEKK
jgi:glycosyltransferase involved in cell wall biosynthesis